MQASVLENADDNDLAWKEEIFETSADSNEGQQTGEGVSDTTLELNGDIPADYDADEEGSACEDVNGDDGDDVAEPATKRQRNM